MVDGAYLRPIVEFSYVFWEYTASTSHHFCYVQMVIWNMSLMRNGDAHRLWYIAYFKYPITTLVHLFDIFRSNTFLGASFSQR